VSLFHDASHLSMLDALCLGETAFDIDGVLIQALLDPRQSHLFADHSGSHIRHHVDGAYLGMAQALAQNKRHPAHQNPATMLCCTTNW
jgi:hypothetical protein